MKQMLLVTDGCSNCGVSPTMAAARAKAEGVTVNVIGLIDEGQLGEQGAREVTEIAEAGGGLSRMVSMRQLAGTMQMMTRQTVAHTIRNTVNRQLREVFAKPDVELLPPAERARVVRMMDTLQETSELRIALLIDSSLSMKAKLPAVEEAVADLLIHLQARTGKSELCLFHFPAGGSKEEVRMLLDWTNDWQAVRQLFARVVSGGNTPTGTAILQVLEHIVAGGGESGQGTIDAPRFPAERIG